MNKKKLPVFGLDILWPYLKPYIGIMTSMVLLGLVGSIMDIILPFFPDYAITHFIEQNTTNGMMRLTMIYIIALIISIIMNGISAYQACQMEMYVGRDLKNAIFEHLQTLSIGYYNQTNVGYLHSRVMSDTDRIGALISWNVMEAVWNLTYIIGAIVVMMYLRLRLALCIIILIPITGLLGGYFQRHLVALGRLMREINSRVTNLFNEGITGAMTIKTLTIEDDMDARFQKETAYMAKTAIMNGHMRGIFISMISFSGFVALALVLWIGGHLTRQGLMELGTLSVFMSYALGMMEPVRWIVRVISDLVTVQVNIERFDGVMKSVPDVKDTAEVEAIYGDHFNGKKENWETVSGHVTFDDVTFRYPDGSVNVLEHFSLDIPQGTMVAIVGETGAGKSTLVNLICRFFEPTAGRILLDGKDLRERSQLWLHSQIGYVLQTPHLFSGTILDNLRFGREDAPMSLIEDVIDRINAKAMIERFEDGYLTDVGEGGSRLSAGERQLVSFARALIVDPALFVLDEATSSVDTMTELDIQKAMEEVMKGRTSFVIAHRLSTIRRADLILVVDDGQIVERGTHQELLALKGRYFELYTRQYEQEANSAFESQTILI
ncbi:MAG: ABC transporter ATP-binding protein [Erysipelotrichaceae bacterium]|nr:ABC transporter ATP-binding protein [Erysipelotrichaceae bacterium]